ncbi:hypothetical protein DFQ04_3181 [Algoriphagus boseongensis]|uniref:Uncharacterized protein n=1 Tax=Algoriphagus boseongensis TaxID=1442587 RepID=A0A4R6T0N1_9BACT|nr:hypothetical protein [Algoriphagus boseongensis]TDQ14593.1 hypothetical protein DFQ04_3181 [Algoriphagus boseongensis]
MLGFLTESVGLLVLATLTLGLFVFFHFILFKEYLSTKRIHFQRITQLENLVQQELDRSKALFLGDQQFHRIKAETEEKLGLIKILLELMGKDKKKGP